MHSSLCVVTVYNVSITLHSSLLSVRGQTRGWQVKMLTSLTTRAIPQRFCDEVASYREAITSVSYLYLFTFIVAVTAALC